MLIGVLSDTHDNTDNVKKAVKIFNRSKVDLVVHAGDITSPFAFKPLEKLKSDFVGIFGNNDGDVLSLQEHSGGRLYKQPYLFEFDGKKIILIHEHHLVEALADSGHYDIVIFGHTHKPLVRKKGATLVVNPGETGSQLYGKATVVIVDLKAMEADIIPLP